MRPITRYGSARTVWSALWISRYRGRMPLVRRQDIRAQGEKTDEDDLGWMSALEYCRGTATGILRRGGRWIADRRHDVSDYSTQRVEEAAAMRTVASRARS